MSQSSHLANIKQIEQTIKKSAKKVIVNSGLLESTRKGNKELEHLVTQLAKQPIDNLANATQLGTALGEKILELSQRMGRKHLDQGVIRQLIIQGNLPTLDTPVAEQSASRVAQPQPAAIVPTQIVAEDEEDEDEMISEDEAVEVTSDEDDIETIAEEDESEEVEAIEAAEPEDEIEEPEDEIEEPEDEIEEPEDEVVEVTSDEDDIETIAEEDESEEVESEEDESEEVEAIEAAEPEDEIEDAEEDEPAIAEAKTAPLEPADEPDAELNQEENKEPLNQVR